MNTDNPHLDKGCPGRDYFERRDKEYKQDIRDVFDEKMGDLPKTLKMVGTNRIWLWALSVTFILTGIILIVITI